jgi:aminopeptidase N
MSSWSWFKVNRGAAGFYRTTYSSATWAALAANAKEVQMFLTSADRAQLIDDAFALVGESTLGPVGHSVRDKEGGNNMYTAFLLLNIISVLP